jgi:isopentenyl-diphosphate delta-isomerase
MQNELLIVNEQDEVLGYGEKLDVHRTGELHRAFSIFILNQQNEILLQRRALHKYHSGGLWANTCCSHPIKGEDQLSTVKRRLYEEMGIETELTFLFSFIYKARLDNGLTEHELDHVYQGYYEGAPNPNPDEVMDWRWVSMEKLEKELVDQSENFVYWIKPAFRQFMDRIRA